MNIIYFTLAIIGGCFLASIAAYWFVVAFMIFRANPVEYERLRRLTGGTRNAFAGTVGGFAEKESTAELPEDDRLQAGIAFDTRRKVLVAQAAISEDALSSVFK